MNQSIDKIFVIRYFDGLCTPEETERVEEWLKEPANELRMQQWLWEDWQETTGKMPADVTARLKEKLDTQTRASGRRSVVQLFRKPYYNVAAAVILALVVAGGFLLRQHFRAAGTGDAVLVYTDSICNKGNHPYKAILPDGSTVWLNGGAVVYLADHFGKTERHVKVDGEAFFDVKKDDQHPFYTAAGAVTTHVLGTAYNVEAYPGEKNIRISLLQGKVSVSTTRNVCVLLPGQMVSYNRQSGLMQAGAVETSDPSAWIKGKIVLNKISLPEALNRLSRLYHVPIHYNYGLIQEKYIAGEFERDTLPGVLSSVLFVHNLKFSVSKNGEYTIY